MQTIRGDIWSWLVTHYKLVDPPKAMETSTCIPKRTIVINPPEKKVLVSGLGNFSFFHILETMIPTD